MISVRTVNAPLGHHKELHESAHGKFDSAHENVHESVLGQFSHAGEMKASTSTVAVLFSKMALTGQRIAMVDMVFS